VIAIPYDYTRDVAANIKLLEGFVANPHFLPYPMAPEEARQLGIALVTNPDNIVFEVRREREIAGIIILTRIAPKLDALLHFLFLDKDLVGKRKLLQNFIDFCFKQPPDGLGFNRLSMEVPEGIRLERFCRKVLRFRLEGEVRPRNPELPACLSDNWVARQGSRIEQGYFNGTEWSDILRLRLLASEWIKASECGAGEPGVEGRADA
jgi:hypothetical protein